MDKIYKLLSQLSNDENDATSFSIPSLIQVNDVLSEFNEYIAILPKLLAFAQEKSKEYPTVKSFPLQQSDIDGIQKDYETAKKLPY